MTFHNEPSHERQAAAAARDAISLCPSLIELAALAESLQSSTDDEIDEQAIAHVSACAKCLEALNGLHRDVADVADEATMMIVPSSVLEAAMALRVDRKTDRAATHPTTLVIRRHAWLRFVRSAAAMAACTGLAFAGHAIGGAFAAATHPLDDRDHIAFGLLDDRAVDTGSEFDLSALLMTMAQGEESRP